MENKQLLTTIHNFIIKHSLLEPESTIIIGLSGGPDSVFLLHFLASYRTEKNLKLIAAHLDHGWRKESALDAQFCQKLTEQYQVPLVIARLAELPISIKANGSQEDIGRKARRYFLEQVAREYKAHAIVLAHHANDQQETFFLRLIRGASLAGLIGMKPKQGMYIRPLLEVKKESILSYLDQHKIPYVTDPSNQSSLYLRNRIRNSVLPALYNADQRFEKTFAATMARLQETESFLQEQTEQTFAQITTNNNGLWLNNAQFLQLHPIMRQRILIHWLCSAGVPFTPTQPFLHEIERFISSTQSNQHRIKHEWVLFKRKGHTTIQSTAS